MKFSEALEQVSGAQLVRNFISKISDNEIFTSMEILQKIHGGNKLQNAIRHSLNELVVKKYLYCIRCGTKNFYTKQKSIAIKFANITGGKIEN